MDQFGAIDRKIQEGYKFIYAHNSIKGCDKWLDAWEDIKELFIEGIAENIPELEQQYDWTEFLSNYVQDLELELHNAGISDKRYHQKRIEYCRELCRRVGPDELIIANTRRGMAEAYFELGDIAAAEQLYEEWLRNDPEWGWGYIGWSDYYHYECKQYDKAEEILLTGYARESLRNRIDVADRLRDLYAEMGQPGKAKEFKEIVAKLATPKSAYNVYREDLPVHVVKIGRNEPCPCGSGKKYKKCCGA